MFGSLLLTSSCKKNISDLNNDPTHPQRVPSTVLLSNAQVNLSDLMAHTNVNYNNFRLFVQYWVEATYVDESRYNLNARSITDRWWAVLYRDIIQDLTESSRTIDAEVADPSIALNADIGKNRKAINEMLTVYAYYVLITTFGDVPYTEALDINNPQPKYDKASDIFTDLAKRLDAALASISAGKESYGAADLFLGGDMEGWTRFGNSLKMRMGMLIADSDPATSKTMVEAAAPNVISSNDENIKMNYLDAPPNTNPVWEDLVQSGREDFVGSQPFIDTLKAHNDPRLPFYFDPVGESGDFVGGGVGEGAEPSETSKPSSLVSNPTTPFVFFSYSEMEFYKAEAAARGYNVDGTVEQHYNNAITASIEEWGGTAADAAAYLARPDVNYATASGDWMKKIGVQSWIAFYNRGYDAWTQWRRLDWPKLNLPFMGSVNSFSTGETPQVIVRMSYPVVEQNLNKANYDAASTSIGKDWKTQKLWFDKQ
jgi:hypothetical protein